MSTPDVSLFPQDIFFLVLSYLEPWDIIRCRRVSRSWQLAFSNPESLGLVLKQKYPLAREVRKLRQVSIASSGSPETTTPNRDLDCWRRAFDQVAAQYFHLGRGKPRSIKKHSLWGTSPNDTYQKWFPVQPWDSHRSHSLERIDYVFGPTPFWTYEDGLLIYASELEKCISLLDLETDRSIKIPFGVEGKVVRRLRLQHRVLVIEWAEPNAFHWLNGHDGVHRHFASLFDIIPSSVNTSQKDWEAVFRNELKIMFLGHPLSDRDRFFSSHNRTHYSIYAWQPNRSLYTADEDAPIESLFVWDISKPSPYRPSEDPSGNNSQEDDGPKIICRFGFRELEFYSVRQRGIPGMIRLEIDSEAETVDITENIGMTRYSETCPLASSSEPAMPFGWSPCVHHITSIPFISHGPCWRRVAEVNYPPYRGNTNMQTEPLTLEGMWYASISEIADKQAQVNYSLHFFSDSWTWDSMTIRLDVRTPRSQATVEYSDVFDIAFKGRIAGDERCVVGQNADGEVVVFHFNK